MKMRRRTLIPSAGLFTLVLLAAPPAPAQSAAFIVSQHGTSVGTASFSFHANSGGIESTSLVRVNMQGLNYALSKTEQLSSTNTFLHVQLSGTVNGSAVNLTAKPETADQNAQILLNISANGRTNSTNLARHKLVVFLPDFDPGALETLLKLAATHNNRDLWAIIPRQAGSIAPIQLATYPDEQGTLNGIPLTVHHLVATISGAQTHLFSGPENQLLQAELPQQGFALVRNGFVLKPSAKPLAPPAEPAPGTTPQSGAQPQPGPAHDIN